MRKLVACLVAAGALAGAPCAWAAEPAAAPGWKGDVELGLVVTDGNTQTQNINAKATAVNERARWKHELHGEALNTSNDGVGTAERYLVTGQSNLKLTEFNYLFGQVSYENDLYSGFDYRVSETVGYGRNLIHSPVVTLDTEVGAGARHSRVTATGDHQDEALGRVAAKLAWKVSGTTDFGQDVTADVGEKATITRSVTSLKSQVAGNLATKLTFTVRNTTDTPPGVKDTDFETVVTLVYSFGRPQ
jgi:putative salt-induced outer membrane protein